MSSESAAAVPEQRLHPLSWLFTLITHARQFAIPLLVLLFTGRGNNYDLWGLFGVGALALVSVAQYFTYRYRVDADGVTIRSGLFQRSVRHIPFARIQNVSLHQNPLHRVFGVAEVRLESAGAAKPEGQMRVLRLAEAHRLEQQVRTLGAAQATTTSGETVAAPAGETLLALDTGEVLRLGLVDNRGMLVVGGAFAFLAQGGDLDNVMRAFGAWITGQANSLHLGIVAGVFAGLALLLLAVVALRVFSLVIALLQYHGFRLVEVQRRLVVERGLLSRSRASLPRHRIQAWSLREGLLHRWLGRQGLRVDTAVVEAQNERGAIRDLVPIATPAVMQQVLQRLLPAAAWPVAQWQPLHPRAWRRKLMVPALLTVVVAFALTIARGPWGLLVLLALPLWLWRARVWARHAGWSVADGLVAFRSGWLDRRWRFAEVGKLQALELTASPFDRRHGMATLRFDTAGASAFEGGLVIPYLPEEIARRLFTELSGRLAGPALTPSRIAASAAPAR